MSTADAVASVRSGQLVVPVARDLIVATGPDTTRFLQGQLAQNVETLADGADAWSLLLQPNGRVVALVRLHRVDADAVLIDCEPGSGARVHAALGRFLIRTKCTLSLHLDMAGWRGCGVRPDPVPGATILDMAPWPGWCVLVTAPDANPQPAFVDASTVDADAAPAVAEALRVVTGEPRHDADLTENSLPSETGLVSVAVAFGKGCYTGQELVERIDSRGRTVKSLVRVSCHGPLAVGQPIVDASGVEVGTITSALDLGDGTSAGIALLRPVTGVVSCGSAQLDVATLIDQP